ncbi:MAG: hypothetical protein MR368_03535 [Azospirillum sp.]|nr:hypothetical protein [Azospirillum sp.]
MFKKLMDGELSLKDTFWKFGVLGLPAITVLVKILGKMLAKKLNNYSILAYYISPKSHIEFSTTILTVMYLSAVSFILFYAVSLLLGTWRSSAEYDRSLWFRHLARIFVVLMLFAALKFTFRF